jgi:hypothetical protein
MGTIFIPFPPFGIPIFPPVRMPTIPPAVGQALEKFFCSMANLGNRAAFQDMVSCACMLAGIADITPIAGILPPIETIDCACNWLTTAQLYCNVGWQSAGLYAIPTILDCVSLPLAASAGAIIGGLIGLPGGPAAFATGALGATVADTAWDSVAWALQNMIVNQSINPLPVASYQACCRLTPDVCAAMEAELQLLAVQLIKSLLSIRALP